MRALIRATLLLLMAGSIILMTGCRRINGPVPPPDPFPPQQQQPGNEEGVPDSEKKDDDNHDDKINQDYGTLITITWSGSGASVDNTGVLPVAIDGGHVVLGNPESAVEDACIVLRGSSGDGSIKFYNGKKTQVRFEGVSLKSSRGPAFNSQCRKHIYICLADGSENFLTDALVYADVPEGEDAKACMFSEGQLIFSGEGSLEVTSLGAHAMASDDYVRINGGTLRLNGAKDGIHVNDHFRMDGGSLEIHAGSDGIQIDEGHASILGGSIVIASGDDGLVTSYEGTDETIAPYISIEGGSLSITTDGADAKGIKSRNFISIGCEDGSGPDIEIATCGASLTSLPLRRPGGGPGGGGPGGGTGGPGGMGQGTSGNSPKAIKAFGTITVNGGNIRISTAQSGAEGIESKSAVSGAIIFNGGNVILRCSDDCINSSGSIVFNGGNVYAWSTGNDAIDSNYGRAGAITIDKGIVMAHSASSPEEGLDCDNNAYITINGGTLLATGGQQGGGGSSTPAHTQGYAMVSTSVSSGYFTITDSEGNAILCCHVPRSLSQAYCMISSPALTAGESYSCGICSTAPEGTTLLWEPYCYEGGRATVSAKSFTAK